jgi:hypothetical protein
MYIFEVFAAQKRKQESKAAKLHELVEPAMQTMPMPPPTTQAKLPELVELTVQTMPMPLLTAQAKPPTTQNKPGLQYHYQATTEDQCLISELQAWLLDGKLIQTTPAHILAASPIICKELIEQLHVH